jgi:hypothetical protein
MADIKSGQDVTSLMVGIKSGDDVTALMSGDVGSSATVPEPPRGRDFKVFGVNIHVPPEDKPRLDSNIATVGGVGIAPEDALMVGQAAKGIAAATSAGGMVAGLKEAVKTANPVVKFEVSRRALKAVGVPDGVAEVIAFGVSGYRRGGKPPVPEGPVSEPGYPRASSTPAPPSAPVEPPAHLDLSQRVPAGGLTQQQIGERLAATKAQGMTAPQVEPVMAPRPSPSSVPVPEGPPEPSMAKPTAPSKSPQQILNEEAIAKRRAAYQESLKADAKPVLEDVEAGKITAEQAAAELAKRWGTPSDAERRFPPNKSGLPSNPPTARKAMGKVSDLAEMQKAEPQSVKDFEEIAKQGRIHSATGKFSKAEEAAKTPISSGETAGYSESDIAKFFVDRRGGRSDLAAYDYVKALHTEGRPISAALWDEVVTKKPTGYVKSGDLYVQNPSNPPTARKARGKVSDLADMPIDPPKPVEPAATPSQTDRLLNSLTGPLRKSAKSTSQGLIFRVNSTGGIAELERAANKIGLSLERVGVGEWQIK